MLIIGNWKAYVERRDDAKDLVTAAKRLALKTRHKLVLAPSAPYLGMLAGGGKRSKVGFGVQDVSAVTVGAATGEVTAGTARQAGATYAIIGHSERRAMGDTDPIVSEKVKRALTNSLTPVLCIGERERDAEAQYLGTLRAQIAAVYEPLSARERLQIVIAYEPVWAIGKRAEDAIRSTDLAEMILYIRKVIATYLPGHNASKVRILYGGSVDASNIRELAGGSRTDGFLIGRASTDPASLGALLKALA